MNRITKANLEDKYLISEILGEAFCDDSVMTYLLGKPDIADKFFSAVFEHIYLPFDCSFYVMDSNNEAMGCALWSRPGQDPNALSFGFLRALWQVRKQLTFSSLKRFSAISNLSQRYHPKEPHYYLCAIGVKQSHRRKGVASQLVSHVLNMADQEQVPAYLENSKEQNLPFYQKYGFEVIHKHMLENNALPVWFMRRSPQPLEQN